MRVSMQQFHDRALRSMLGQQAAVSRTALQISSGQRILSPSDDPVGASSLVDLSQALARASQYRANGVQARGALELEDGVLGQVTELLHRARVLVVQGNSDTYDNESRRALAVEMGERLAELVGLANTRGANGDYIFSGFQTQVQPFLRDAAGNVSYLGDQGQRYVQVGAATHVPAGDAGSAIFMAMRDGNGVFATADGPGNTGTGIIDPGSVTDLAAWVPDTYTITFIQALPDDPVTYEVYDSGGVLVASGTYQSETAIEFRGIQVSVAGAPVDGDQFTVRPSIAKSVFATIKDLADALDRGVSNPVSAAVFHNAMNRGLAELEQAFANVNEHRARIGTRLNVIEDQDNVHQDLELQLEGARSEIADLDYAEAFTRLSRQQLALEAAQLTYARVQGLSLLNFLR